MKSKERYNHLNTYYKNKFGERTLKICIDAGFTCPNRDNTLSNKGCIFCIPYNFSHYLCSLFK